jgi:predicted membrane channel-forming protein YqfA (hemolysin III family)
LNSGNLSNILSHSKEQGILIWKNKRRYLEWGFWLGIGLMSIINILKIIENQHAISYSLIMFGISIMVLIIYIILIKK